jgi:hypothetical protein
VLIAAAERFATVSRGNARTSPVVTEAADDLDRALTGLRAAMRADLGTAASPAPPVTP